MLDSCCESAQREGGAVCVYSVSSYYVAGVQKLLKKNWMLVLAGNFFLPKLVFPDATK